jgi:hypothetical protein
MEELGHVCHHGCDLNVPALQGMYGHRVCADARSLPYADCSFDGVTTSGTLMHVGQDDHLIQTVQELARVARTWILCVELWQPKPIVVEFGDLMPRAWVYPWERVVPTILGESWALVRSAIMRSCGRVQRVQALSILLMYREPTNHVDDKGNALWGEGPYPWWTR